VRLLLGAVDVVVVVLRCLTPPPELGAAEPPLGAAAFEPTEVCEAGAG
jgi:hypothetical protein